MKNINYKLLAFCLPVVLLLSGCFFDEDDVTSVLEVIVADLGEDQMVAIGESVTISFSNSTSSDNAQYILSFQNGPQDQFGGTVIDGTDGSSYSQGTTVLNTFDKNETFSFTPPRNGDYSFRLEIFGNNGSFGSDEVTITVSGAIELTASNINDFSLLSDQNNGGSGADYFVNEVVEITQYLEVGSLVDIEFGANGGFHINEGTFAAYNGLNLYGSSGWKGLLMTSGFIEFSGVVIDGAGASAFSGYDPAAITVEGGGIGLIGSTFSNSSGMDVNLMEDAYVYSSLGFYSNTFDLEDAIHCDFFQVADFGQNSYADGGPSLITVTGAGDTFLNTGAGSFDINAGDVSYYFKGGASFGQYFSIQMSSGNTIYFEENTGIIFSAGCFINGDVNNTADRTTLKGWDGGSWKGIYLGSSNNQLLNLTIEDAGSSAHSLGFGVTSAVYTSGLLERIRNVSINTSNSYGLYMSTFSGVDLNYEYENVSFADNTAAAIVAPADLASNMLNGTGNSFTFSNANDVEAFRLLSSNSTSSQVSLPDLGGDNYYLVEENLSFNSGSGGLALEEGAHLKFMPNTSIYFGSSGQGSFEINGTASNPVILEASDVLSGWDGVYLGSTSSVVYSFDYAEISGAGARMLTGATEQANLTLRASNATYSFTNSTFSDSMGWGVVLESFSASYDFMDVAHANTFSNNTSGDVNDKTP